MPVSVCLFILTVSIILASSDGLDVFQIYFKTCLVLFLILTTVNSILTEIKDSNRKKLKLQVRRLKNQEPTQKKVCNCWLIIPMACLPGARQYAAGELSEWESRASASG